MWPFSKKSTPPPPNVTVAQALDQLAAIGIRPRLDATPDDLLSSLDCTLDSPVDWTNLLCTLGEDVQRAGHHPISDDIWHCDAECIVQDGDYVLVLERFVLLTKGLLPLTNLRDHVDIENGEAWVEFTLDGQTVHWDLEVHDDWLDPCLYTKMQNLVLVTHGDAKRFFITGLGQDSLIGFGTPALKDSLSSLSGLKFQWE